VKRKFRLTKSSEFKRVRRNGKSYAHPLIVLIALPKEDDEHTQFGISAGRSVGTAVRRNRAKRLLKEALRPMVPDIKKGWYILVLSRRPLAHATLKETRSALFQQLKRAQLLMESDEN
jgi:ribonuclease P protein component